MARHWRIFGHDTHRIAELERETALPPVVAQLLVRRGVTDSDAAKLFLDARLTGLRDPNSLPGLTAAAELIHQSITRGEKIVIYGDYDADGMTASAILVGCLRLLGASVSYHVPNRMDEGYGLHADSLARLHELGARMVISVDCGIASLEAARRARELGLQLVITDHHTLADRLPVADAIVHPRLPGSHYPFGGLCGAGVAFKLAWALCQRASNATRVSPRMREYLLSAVGLAAIGTVADVVPLVDENRIIVRHGLRSLRERPPLGLRQLMKITQLDKKSSLASEDIGFSIGPRLNAAGRLGQAALGIELLTTDSEERAEALAQYIHELNDSRESLERSIYLAARKQIDEKYDPEADPALVLAGEGWHQGVIGIVAGRMAEKHHRPVVMIALDDLRIKPGTGSARSACGLNLHQALQACSEHLLAYGGHAAAAGLRIEPDRVDAFREDFCEYAAGEITAEDRIAEVLIDAEAPLSQLTINTVNQIEQLAPFGAGNPRPVLCATGVKLAEAPRRMGGGDRHMTVRFDHHGIKLRAVAFGQGDWADELAQVDGEVDLAYRPVINEFNGMRKVELHLVDWRVSGDQNAVEEHKMVE